MSQTKCSLCGSPGTNKSTCPCNSSAANPNYKNHPNWDKITGPFPIIQYEDELIDYPPPIIYTKQTSPNIIQKSNSKIIIDFLHEYLARLGFRLLHCSVFGSHVYGTAREHSDWDLIVIIEPYDPKYENDIIMLDVHHSTNAPSIHTSEDALKIFNEMEYMLGDIEIDLSIRSLAAIKQEVEKGSPYAIEFLFTPKKFVLFTTPEVQSYINSVDFSLLHGFKEELKSASKLKKLSKSDLETIRNILILRYNLRSGFSEKARWAQDAAIKRFRAIAAKGDYVGEDKEIDRALKSLYHAFRIYNYGIQVGLYGKIVDWEIANPYWEELSTLDKKHLTEQFLKDFHKDDLKTLVNEFNKALPKPIAFQLKAVDLEELL